MLVTRGTDFFNPSPDAMAWVKHVRRIEDFNLDETGAYAFACKFTNFDEDVRLQPDDFLFVGCQEDHPPAGTGTPGGPQRRYRFALFSGVPQGWGGDDMSDGSTGTPTLIDDEQLRASFYRAVDAGVVPQHKQKTGRNNKGYLMAVYCYMHYWSKGNKPKVAKSQTAQRTMTAPFVPTGQKKRRIDLDIVAEPDDTDKRTPRKEPRGNSKRKPRRPPPHYRL